MVYTNRTKDVSEIKKEFHKIYFNEIAPITKILGKKTTGIFKISFHLNLGNYNCFSMCAYIGVNANYNAIVSQSDFGTYALLCGVAVVSLIVIYLNKSKNQTEKLNEIKLDDEEFNKFYRAYSSDEVEVRYLITNSFMEWFKNLQTAFGKKSKMFIL